MTSLAVVSLPAGVFKPYAGVKTGVLVFRRPPKDTKTDKKAKQKEKVWFYDVRIDGYDPDKVSGGGRPETPERNDLPELLTQWGEYRNSGFKKPPGIEANTLLEAGSTAPTSWWATVKRIAENDYNLAAGRYKPHTAEAAPDDDPVDLIRDTLKLERDMAGRLEELLSEVETTE